MGPETVLLDGAHCGIGSDVFVGIQVAGFEFNWVFYAGTASADFASICAGIRGRKLGTLGAVGWLMRRYCVDGEA